MIAIPSMSGRHVAVLGLGRSGMAAARALVHSGAHVLAWDDDEECRGRAGAEDVPLADLIVPLLKARPMTFGRRSQPTPRP